MKQFLKTSILLLLALLLPAAATAYDFEVDGIYYNITSPNTVEVTYSVIDYSSVYFDTEIVIPSQVTYNSVNYNVTAIGDSAFIHSHTLRLTIPQSINYIGVDAFYNTEPAIITCLSETPPDINNSFTSNRESFPYYYYFDKDKEYYYAPNYYDYYEHDNFIVLLVPSSGYESYKELNDIHHFFNWIYCYDWEKTEAPSSTIDFSYYVQDELSPEFHYPRIKISFAPNEESRVLSRVNTKPAGYWYIGTWGEDSVRWLDYNNPWREFFCDGDSYAVAEGKLPSDLTHVGGGSYQPSNLYYNYDFEDSGIAYSYVSDSTVMVVSLGYYEEFNIDSLYYSYYPIYSGDIVIPSTVNGYVVREIGCKAFANTSITSISLPNTIQFIRWDAFKDCKGLSELFLPQSLLIVENSFSGCSLKQLIMDVNTYISGSGLEDVETVYVLGEGEIPFDSNEPICNFLPYYAKTFCFGGGVKGLKGMMVNPETIYCFATTPPICNEYSFTGYDAELHVPASSVAAYFTAPYWCNFTNIIGDAKPLTNITINKDSIQVQKGNQDTIRATLNPANAMPNTVTWSSSNKSVAKVENGVVTALSAGECDITATCQDKRAVCHVTVTEILPTSVTLDQENVKTEIGSQFTLTATVLPEDATDKTVSWRSSNQSVATVDENGVVTAVGTGECDITAYCRGKQAVCHVTVVEQFIYISLDQHEASVLPNHIIMLTPTVSPVSTDLVVTSSNPAVAAARMAGNKIQVVGVSEGEATIVVNSADGYAFADSCQVKVYTERGDVNGDGFVDIADVSALIDYLLGGDASEVNEVNADTDANGGVSIADVSMLIDYLLGSTVLPPKEEDGMVEYTVNGVTFKMVKVDGGSFTMGATEEEDADYQVFKGSPKHPVTLSKYWIGQTEVTQELWAAVMGSNPSTDQSNLQYPVNSISWEDCATFISQLNQLTGKQFRLPTEAEWEYAAKGGAKSMGYVYSGSDNLDEVAWFSTNSESHLHQVGTKKANELGLYDMCGNIDEWCNDWYSLYTADSVENPTGPETGMSRIHRGGRWNASAMYCRLTRRDGFAPGVTRNYLGLRLALTE
jgi:formylglycine-generating enzyme required for sulfatase activity/uncharacterized protein YjdB